MQRITKLIFVVLATVIMFIGCQKKEMSLQIDENVGDLLKRFAPVEVTADISFLPENEKQALAKLIQASQYMDKIFLRQVWEKNPEYKKMLARRSDTLGRDAYQYFLISFGLWDRLEHDASFISDMKKPDGAGYYPVDFCKNEFETYVEKHPDPSYQTKLRLVHYPCDNCEFS